jgi:hypothetical protein
VVRLRNWVEHHGAQRSVHLAACAEAARCGGVQRTLVIALREGCFGGASTFMA